MPPTCGQRCEHHVCLPAAMRPTVMVMVTSEPVSPKELLYKLPLSWGSLCSNRKVTKTHSKISLQNFYGQSVHIDKMISQVSTTQNAAEGPACPPIPDQRAQLRSWCGKLLSSTFVTVPVSPAAHTCVPAAWWLSSHTWLELRVSLTAGEHQACYSSSWGPCWPLWVFCLFRTATE